MVELEVSKYVILELNFRWVITGAKAISRKHGDLWRIINPAILHEIEFIWKNKKKTSWESFLYRNESSDEVNRALENLGATRRR